MSKDKMTPAEREAERNEKQGSLDAQRNLGRKPIGRKMTITVTRDKKRSSKRK
jgi:hypothetical protein